MTSKKQYLTAHVHRLEDGALKTYAPGDVAPDWVTNAKILTDDAPGSAEAGSSEPSTPPAGTNAQGGASTNDDLDLMDGKALKEIAGQLGVAKNGSLDAIRERIRAKRSENASDPVAANTGDDAAAEAERTALIAKLREQGHEVSDDITEAELAALTEEQE